MKVYIDYTEMYPVLYIREESFDNKEPFLEIPDDLIHNYREAEKDLKIARRNIETYAKNKRYIID